MHKKLQLDEFEQEIEDNFESLKPVPDMVAEVVRLQQAAAMHAKRRRSITLRVHEMDLEAMKIKSSKLGMPYQTYINMLIHKDASSEM